MNNVNSFTFYKDYFNLIDTIPIKDKKEILNAIVDYVFKDIEPILNGHNQAIFNTLKRQLGKSKNKSSNAKKDIQNEIKTKSNENQNEIKTSNKTSVLSFKFYISNFKFINSNELLKQEVEKWLKYKTERKESYKEVGLNTLLGKIEKHAIEYGVEEMVNAIEESIANNYKGIVFEYLKKNKHKKTAFDLIDELEC